MVEYELKSRFQCSEVKSTSTIEVCGTKWPQCALCGFPFLLYMILVRYIQLSMLDLDLEKLREVMMRPAIHDIHTVCPLLRQNFPTGA